MGGLRATNALLLAIAILLCGLYARGSTGNLVSTANATDGAAPVFLYGCYQSNGSPTCTWKALRVNENGVLLAVTK